MADVARAAGVHQTTVSLALRNDPRLPRETRVRIRALAESMGYRPDPMLSALNFYRTSRDTAKTQPTIAFLMHSRKNLPAENFSADERFLKGAGQACDRMGFRIVPVPIENSPTEGTRLTRVLRSRGIYGVILASLHVTLREFALDWDCFSALCIESQHLRLSLHAVANNQTGATRTAVRRLIELGYRRIGVAVGEIEETSLGKPFSAGHLLEIHGHHRIPFIDPLLLRVGADARLAATLGAWVRRNRIDAVLSNWSNVPALLKIHGLRVPEDVGFATLDHNQLRGAAAGIRQSHELVGERAAEGLALLMKTNQRGLITLPNTTLIDGVWQDGPELPPKRAPAVENGRSSVKRRKLAH